MPLTEGLYPGRFYTIGGQVMLPAHANAPSYNDQLNWCAGGNLNSSLQFHVFERLGGVIQSQNQTLLNQENYNYTQGNQDVGVAIRGQQHMKPLDAWMMINDAKRIGYKRPYYKPQRNGG